MSKSRRHKFGDEMLLLEEIAERVGKTKSALKTLMANHNCDAETAAKMTFNRPVTRYLWRGENLTFEEICERINAKPSSLKAMQYRYRTTVQDAAEFHIMCTQELYEYDGEALTAPEISAKSNVPMSVIRHYMRMCNMTPPEAVMVVKERRAQKLSDLTLDQLRRSTAERICLQLFPTLESASFRKDGTGYAFDGEDVQYNVKFEAQNAHLTAAYRCGAECTLNRTYTVR